ncbi:MAG: ABC transporter substrate-binding protein [Gammaproteobacteria bacterium]
MRRRIVSLLPSATEMICALGLRDDLVGVSHECDHPPDVVTLPRVTATRIAHGLTSAEIDRQVREELGRQTALYTLDHPLLTTLAPDLLVTQALCDVCAVSAEEVAAAACALPRVARVFNLQPERLDDVLDSLVALAEAAGTPAAGVALRAALAARIAAVAARSATLPLAVRPRVALLEWLDPLFDAGHWNPELVTLAGGEPVFGRVGRPSTTREWSALAAAAPDVIVIACCGFDVTRTLDDVRKVARRPEWNALRAVRAGCSWVMDGNAYFNRPGPRLVDSLELLAHVLHPALHPMPAGVTPAVRFGG